MILYHRTTADGAHAILSGGFRDATGYYLSRVETAGVWLSDRPIDANEGAKGKVLLRVVLPIDKRELRQYEWIKAGKSYREWQLPASLVNKHRLALVVIDGDVAA